MQINIYKIGRTAYYITKFTVNYYPTISYIHTSYDVIKKIYYICSYLKSYNKTEEKRRKNIINSDCKGDSKLEKTHTKIINSNYGDHIIRNIKLENIYTKKKDNYVADDYVLVDMYF